MAKSNTTTVSDDALYLTDDLEGRLDEADLVAPVKSFVTPTLETNEYSEIEEIVEKPAPTLGKITLGTDQECWMVTAELRTLSFGKGWLCSLEGVDKQAALAMTAAYAQFNPSIEVVVEAGGERFELSGNLDFTVSFGYGGCSFTVAADDGRYVTV